MANWKPTASEAALIREYAQRECRCRVRLEPGIRCNTERDGVEPNMNLALVTDDLEHWGDTDLYTHATWSEFRKGVELSPDGTANVDFYCYSLGHDGELESNIDVLYRGGRIEQIYGTEFKVMYQAENIEAWEDARDDEFDAKWNARLEP